MMHKESENKHLRCCVYARGSTDEQAERDLSIPFQLERCRYYTQGKSWEVVKEFDIILVHKLDRFARNNYDFVIYEKELADLGIRLESVSEPGDDSTPAGYISRRIMQVISSWYSKNLAVEVKKGMQCKVEIGGWPKPAPMGYINKRDGNKAWIEVDTWYGPFITKAFDEMVIGKWTLDEWADQAYSLGYKTGEGNRIRKQTYGAKFFITTSI
jgi:hypothetical protein